MSRRTCINCLRQLALGEIFCSYCKDDEDTTLDNSPNCSESVNDNGSVHWNPEVCVNRGCDRYVYDENSFECNHCLAEKEQPTPHIPYIELPYKNCLNCGISLESLDYSTTRCCYQCEQDEKQQLFRSKIT